MRNPETEPWEMHTLGNCVKRHSENKINDQR